MIRAEPVGAAEPHAADRRHQARQGNWQNGRADENEGVGVFAVERGQIDLVWQVVEGLRSGSQL